MADNLTSTITELEHQTWQALQKSGADILPFLAPDAIMLFPLGMCISHTSEPSLKQVMTSEAFKPWKSYEMKETKVIAIGTEGAVITYKAEASRSDDDPLFRAVCSTTWRKGSPDSPDKWLLVVHQQTPYEREL